VASNATAHGAAVVGNKLNAHLVPNTLPGGVQRDAEQVLCGSLVKHCRDTELQVAARLGGRRGGDGGVEEAAEERRRDAWRVGGRREHVNDELEQGALVRAVPRRREDLGQDELRVAPRRGTTTAGSARRHLNAVTTLANERGDNAASSTFHTLGAATTPPTPTWWWSSLSLSGTTPRGRRRARRRHGGGRRRAPHRTGAR